MASAVASPKYSTSTPSGLSPSVRSAAMSDAMYSASARSSLSASSAVTTGGGTTSPPR